MTKPAHIKECVEVEHFWHKVKIACLSLFMAAVATTYGGYFDNLVFRSGMWQQQALGNKVETIDFIDKLERESLPTDGFYKGTDGWKNSPTYAGETWEGEQRR